MTRRVAIAALSHPAWAPPGTDPTTWQCALAEDLLDVLATLAEVEAAVLVEPGEEGLRSRIGWPGLHWYAGTDVKAALDAAHRDGYDQAVVLAGDAPDLPGMLIAKLLRPLTSRPVALAPAVGGTGLLGLAARLPAPPWLPGGQLDAMSLAQVRAAAPQAADVASAPGWHRLRGPDDLRRLDPGLEGWDATRALLSGRG